MQARASMVTKLTKVSGKQLDFYSTENSFYFFLGHGLSYKLDFGVINSLKQYLLKDIFVLKKDCPIFAK